MPGSQPAQASAVAEIRAAILYRVYSVVATDAIVMRKSARTDREKKESKSALLDIAALADAQRNGKAIAVGVQRSNVVN